MQLLEQRIARDGFVKDHEVLMVGSFLNHQIDPDFVDKLAEELHRRFEGRPVTKVLTIEASGIAIAYATALRFGVPMVFAKKTQSRNLAGEVYSASIRSFTRGGEFDAIMPKRFLGPEDHVLIVDDFLATGCALEGLIDIAAQAGATIEGLGVVIEKGFEPGGKALRKKGYRLESLAIVKSMNPDTGEIVFDHDCDPH